MVELQSQSTLSGQEKLRVSPPTVFDLNSNPLQTGSSEEILQKPFSMQAKNLRSTKPVLKEQTPCTVFNNIKKENIAEKKIEYYCYFFKEYKESLSNPEPQGNMYILPRQKNDKILIAPEVSEGS